MFIFAPFNKFYRTNSFACSIAICLASSLFSVIRIIQHSPAQTIDLSLSLMAYVPLVSIFFFSLLVTGKAQLVQPGNVFLGSSLFPHTQLTSWVSASGLFAFGFYRQDNGFAVGIWLASKPEITVVWTANRDDPPLSVNSTIEFTRDGRLLLLTNLGEEKPIAQTEGSATSASMLDSGNFVIYNHSLVIWQSFDYPSDTILGGQNLSSSSRLVSSVSNFDHSSGRFYLSMQFWFKLAAYPANCSGQPGDAYWSIQGIRGQDMLLELNRTGYLLFHEDLNVHNLASGLHPRMDEKVIYRATLDPDGNFRLYMHRFSTIINSTLSIEWSALRNPCEAKGYCGVNSFCSSTDNKADCLCFPGFLFLNQSNKFLGCYRNFTDEEGCRRRGSTLSYNITGLENVELGGYPYSVMSLSKDACGRSCLDDCNCWATLYVNGSCNKLKLPIMYGKEDENISATAFIKISFPTPQVADHEIRNQKLVTERKKTLVFVLAVSLGFIALLCTMMAISSFFLYRGRAQRYQKMSKNANIELNGEFTLQSFSFDELEKATDGFKDLLGRNSFGAVYKGVLSEGKSVVAVKRLERAFEGDRGFRAEMAAIGQTHHRNLVQLRGFCIEGVKKLLVYEFMSNGSLADLLFKAETRPSWNERVRIVLDVARGILYLHEECEAHIIHCNIKPQNILFDDSWTAKISDFGLAKLLMPNQSGTLTGIRGSRGYLAPEWHKNTLISTKVDIYSFGVVLLEILCCRSNMEVNVSTADEILLSTWVYNCFIAKELNRLIGDEEVDLNTLERMAKVGLLCIQDDPNARPSIKNVILMLEGTTNIPVPPSPTPPLLISMS